MDAQGPECPDRSGKERVQKNSGSGGAEAVVPAPRRGLPGEVGGRQPSWHLWGPSDHPIAFGHGPLRTCVDMAVEWRDYAPADPVRMRLVQSLPPHTLQSLLAIEQDAFPVCERLGRHAMVEHAMCRANGLGLGLLAADGVKFSSAAILGDATTELAGFLRQQSRALKQTTLETQEILVRAHGRAMAPALLETVLTEAAALIDDVDLHLTHLALRVTISVIGAAVGKPSALPEA